VVAIAGITAENVEQVLATGVAAVAVTAAVAGCDDPRAATERLKERMTFPKLQAADCKGR